MPDDPGGIVPPPGGFHPPVKRSMTIAAHPTSISLEPIFWDALEAAAAARGLPLSALVAQVDYLRIQANDPPNLASALRSWLLTDATIMKVIRISVDSANDSQ